MARGRKGTRIKVMTNRDKNLLRQLSKTGLSTSNQAQKYFGVNNERLNKLQKSGYIKTDMYTVRGKSCRIVQLDKGGKNYCRQEFGTQSFCIAQTNHLEHDIKLTETYCNLKEDIQHTWEHENQIIRDFYKAHPDKQQGYLVNCVDATIQVNGQLIAIESVGSSYTQVEINIKEEIAIEELGCSEMRCV